MPSHRKLGKPTDQRMAMLRAMTTYLLENGQIKTTVTRAKEVAPLAEKIGCHSPQHGHALNCGLAQLTM